MAEKTEFERLTEAAEGNQIRLEDGAAKECARICGEMIDKLTAAINAADSLDDVQGFGNITNANDIAQRYNDRAADGDSSLKYVLTKHREVVGDMLETFIAAGRAYLVNEDASAAQLASYDEAVDEHRP